jgi:hypothetical protein
VITWPDTLVSEVARRRCAFFLGAGVSAAAVGLHGERPKDWKGFLTDACSLVSPQAKRSVINKLIKDRRYLLALQAIKTSVDGGDYHEFLNKNFNVPAYQPSKLHEIIYNLDSRIVITTNFDKIYEKYCLGISNEGFKVISYDMQSLGDELRSDTRVIIKAHGLIDNIQNMVFTRAEYHSMKQKHPSFYELLKAIFLLNTVIFIGCSLEDPDVVLLLEEVKITASGHRPHYILIRRGAHHEFSVRDWQQTYNVRALQYDVSHDNLIKDLETLRQKVEAVRAVPGAPVV